MHSLLHATHYQSSPAYAFFFDIDGTLAPIAATPDEAHIPSEILTLIARIQRAGSPVAMVSGRTIVDIDRMCQPEHFCAAGQHGLEIRHMDGRIYALADNTSVMKHVMRRVQEFQNHYPELLFEYKGLSIAVHYRNAPQLQAQVDIFLNETAVEFSDTIALQKGKMVGELRLKGASKGEAITKLMKTAPFAGCTPVFAGDDLTDEAGFEAVNILGGVSIKIGEGDTRALHRMENPKTLHEWLRTFQLSIGASI